MFKADQFDAHRSPWPLNRRKSQLNANTNDGSKAKNGHMPKAGSQKRINQKQSSWLARDRLLKAIDLMLPFVSVIWFQGQLRLHIHPYKECGCADQ
jgi:hypothetical protein